MTPDDRVAAILYLLGIPTVSYIVGVLIYGAWLKRPAVTRCPFTGRLYIPRSNLHITGRYTRRHGPR